MNTAAQRLVIDRVSKGYGARRVLQNIVVDVATGEALLVTGHNGVGKSTLLRLLAGLQRPSSGHIGYTMGGRELDPVEARPAIGMVSPDLQLYRELTAHEHIEFVADVRGLRCSRSDSDTVLTEVGLEGRGDELIGRFSSGMAQRLRYALALLHRPTILLLDEPTTNLDVAGVALVDRIVEQQRRQGIVVVATNDPRDRKYGDYLLPLGEATS